jgi:hypothetical protein
MVTVHIFDDMMEQTPIKVNVEESTCQDIITNLIKTGYKSGQIYTLDGNPVDFDAVPSEMKYITYSGNNYSTLFVRKLIGGVVSVPFSSTMKVRDIYNYIVAQGYPKNIKLMGFGKQLDLDLNVETYNLSKESMITVVIPSTDQKTTH